MREGGREREVWRDGGREGRREGGCEGVREGEREGEGVREGGRVPLCIAMHRNVLFDRWRISFDVMAITEWVQMAWNGCIIGYPSKVG